MNNEELRGFCFSPHYLVDQIKTDEMDELCVGIPFVLVFPGHSRFYEFQREVSRCPSNLS